MKTMLLAILLALFSNSAIAAAPQCASAAIVQAKKLLLFHVGGDDRVEVESTARQLPSIANPANRNQKFLVLDVRGYVYKGEYRMRLIYYPVGGECVLMGQEILELANL